MDSLGFDVKIGSEAEKYVEATIKEMYDCEGFVPNVYVARDQRKGVAGYYISGEESIRKFIEYNECYKKANRKIFGLF